MRSAGTGQRRLLYEARADAAGDERCQLDLPTLVDSPDISMISLLFNAEAAEPQRLLDDIANVVHVLTAG